MDGVVMAADETIVGKMANQDTRNHYHQRKQLYNKQRLQRQAFRNEFSQAAFEQFILDKQAEKDSPFKKIKFASRGVNNNMPEDETLAGFRHNYSEGLGKIQANNAADQILAIGRLAFQRYLKESFHDPGTISVAGEVISKTQKIPNVYQHPNNVPGIMGRLLKEFHDSRTLAFNPFESCNSDNRIQMNFNAQQYEIAYKTSNGLLIPEVYKDGLPVNASSDRELALTLNCFHASVEQHIHNHANPEQKERMNASGNEISSYISHNIEDIKSTMSSLVNFENLNSANGLSLEDIQRTYGSQDISNTQAQALLYKNFTGPDAKFNVSQDIDTPQTSKGLRH